MITNRLKYEILLTFFRFRMFMAFVIQSGMKPGCVGSNPETIDHISLITARFFATPGMTQEGGVKYFHTPLNEI